MFKILILKKKSTFDFTAVAAPTQDGQLQR